MRNLKCIMAFDGSGFHGFQSQPCGNTIQQTVEDAIFKITGEKIKIIGCGRTDAGVHGENYCFNFLSDSSVPSEKFPFALNSYLPETISVKECCEASIDFHASFSAKGKTYVYTILNSKLRNPFLNRYSWFYPIPLDAEKMRIGASYLLGEHDFKAFMAQGGNVKTTVRELTEAKITKENDIVEIALTGNGFLYNMVRIITGTLVDVGTGKIPPEYINEIISGLNRETAGQTAPPCGLRLKEVYY